MLEYGHPWMRILAVAYNFPPIGGAGVQRNLRLVAGLSRLGAEMVVVTGPAETTSLWAPHDAGLAAETPPEIEIHRLAGPEPATSSLASRLERLARVESEWSRWWRRGVVDLGRRVGRGCDLVWALMQPYASAEPVAELADALGVPWAADLADPWALDEMQLYPSALHRRLARREMRRALESARGIVTSTREADCQLVRSFPELADRPRTIGPVGWDRRDFEADPPSRSDDAFRIVHTGYLHTELGRKQRRSARVRRWLGGSLEGVDILTRSHVHLLRALNALVERRPELRGRLELHLAGVQTAADHDVQRGAIDVRMLGYLEHPAVVSLMVSADLLFLPMHDLPPGRRATIVPGKTYEYLASGRPILAAVPDGDARDILAAAGTAYLCRPSDEAGMTDIVSRRFNALVAAEPDPVPDLDVVNQYEYGRLCSDLAAFFDSLV